MPDLNPRVAEILREHRKWWSVQSAVATCTGPGCGWSKFGTAKRTDDAHAHHQAELIAAALRPRIETVEELDALPPGSVVRGKTSSYERFADGHWWRPTAPLPVSPSALHVLVPARVLYTPEADRG